MSSNEFLSQGSADMSNENTSRNRDLVEGAESETSESADGFSDAPSSPESRQMPRKKKEKASNQMVLSVASGITTKKKAPPNALDPKSIPPASRAGKKPHVPQKTSKNLLTYIEKQENYIEYLEKSYFKSHHDHCDTNIEFNEMLKLKTKNINQFTQLTERINKTSLSLSVTRVELTAVKERRDEFQRECKESKRLLVLEKKQTKALKEQVNASSQPIQESAQVTLQRLRLERMDKEVELEKMKTEAALLIDRNKANCQDQLHDNKTWRNIQAKETERNSLKEKKKERNKEMMATSSRNNFGFVSVSSCIFAFASSLLPNPLCRKL
jgi:hypothetical protein